MTDAQRTASQSLLDAQRSATAYAARYAQTDSPAALDAYNASIARVQAATAAYHNAAARVALG